MHGIPETWHFQNELTSARSCSRRPQEKKEKRDLPAEVLLREEEAYNVKKRTTNKAPVKKKMTTGAAAKKGKGAALCPLLPWRRPARCLP